MSSSLEIDITRQAGDWPEIQAVLEKAVNTAFSQLGLKGEGEVSIVLADDAFVKNLNRDYRGKDKPTNVLSFPQLENISGKIQGALGDIVLGFETVRREAEESGKSFADHVTHLVVHGFLHLLGHDHENEAEAEEMENAEIQILKILGIKNPYEI